MLKVLILSRDLGMQGGVANLVQTISEKFSSQVETHHFFIGKSPGSGYQVGRLFKPIVDALKLFKQTQHHYDVIHINPSLDIKSVLRDGLFMLMIHMRKKQNTLVFFHGWDERLAKSILNNRILCFFMCKTFGKARKIMVLARNFAKQLIDMGIDENRLIMSSTMFYGSIFDGVKKQVGGNGKILLFMSRLVAGKGMLELLDAFYKIQMRRDSIILHMVGDGPEKAVVEKKISDLGLQGNVKLFGYLTGKEKAQTLLNADIFILPTYYPEGCPISLLEAMAAGLPVITTAVAGIPDIVTDGKNGVLLTSHTPDAIEHGIEIMLENDSKRREIGELNRKTAWENYESRIVTSKIEQIYRQVAGVK